MACAVGWRQRAQWAQQNSWEAFAPFAAAVIVAYLMMVTPQQLDAAAAVFIVKVWMADPACSITKG